LLPSSWGAEIIIGFASNPGNISAVGFVTLTRFGGLLLFFVAALWLGAKAANRAYSLEPTTFIASRAKPDGVFYKTVKLLGGGGSFAAILVSVFKDYSRRLENLSNVTYILSLLIIMNIFLRPTMPSDDNGPLTGLITAQLIFPIIVAMVVGEVTVRGKDNLVIFRKTPSGVRRYVKAKLLHGWIMVVPIAALFTAAIAASIHQFPFFSVVITTGLMMLIMAANVAFVIGLFCLNPAFSEKSIKLWLNVIIAVFVPVGLFLLSLVVLMGAGLEPLGGMPYVLLLQTPLNWLVGIVFLLFGQRRLSRIE
jgi:hypothetical protein